jgi:hypothetical protein
MVLKGSCHCGGTSFEIAEARQTLTIARGRLPTYQWTKYSGKQR